MISQCVFFLVIERKLDYGIQFPIVRNRVWSQQAGLSTDESCCEAHLVSASKKTQTKKGLYLEIWRSLHTTSRLLFPIFHQYEMAQQLKTRLNGAAKPTRASKRIELHAAAVFTPARQPPPPPPSVTIHCTSRLHDAARCTVYSAPL